MQTLTNTKQTSLLLIGQLNGKANFDLVQAVLDVLINVLI